MPSRVQICGREESVDWFPSPLLYDVYSFASLHSSTLSSIPVRSFVARCRRLSLSPLPERWHTIDEPRVVTCCCSFCWCMMQARIPQISYSSQQLACCSPKAINNDDSLFSFLSFKDWCAFNNVVITTETSVEDCTTFLYNNTKSIKQKMKKKGREHYYYHYYLLLLSDCNLGEYLLE